MTTVTQAVEQLVRAAVGMSDEDMARPWAWRMYDEEGLRFALLMTHHEMRDLAVRLAASRDGEPSQARRILTQYHQAYRDMTGVLAAVSSEDLDRAPATSASLGGPGPGSGSCMPAELAGLAAASGPRHRVGGQPVRRAHDEQAGHEQHDHDHEPGAQP